MSCNLVPKLEALVIHERVRSVEKS